MTTIHDKFAKAKEAYKEALIRLAMARQAYEAGSGKAYAELLQRCEELRSKITAHEQAAADSHDLFRRAFAAANYTQTKEVKNALFNKNDAATMAEELRLALAECEANTFEPQVQASNDAKSYLIAHRAAFEAYAHLQVYQALAEMGEPLARALALVRHCERPRQLTITDDPEARREAFVWACIKEMASAHPVADELPAIEALGALELGPFANRQFMSPMEIHKARNEMQDAAET